MKSISKKIAVLLAALLLVSSPIQLSAANVDPGYDVMPCWEYMHGINIGIHFNGTNGVADVSVIPLAGRTTYLEATLCVYRRTGGDWTLVASTSGSDTSSLCLDVSFTAVYGQTYKAEVTATAYGENGSETDTVSIQDNCPKQEDA